MSKPDQTFYYLDQLCEYLIFMKRDVDFGQGERHYRLDESNPEFYFFAKCPEAILDVNVHHIYGGKLHQADSISPTPRRFFFTKTKLTNEELDASLMEQKFTKTGNLFIHKYMIAFHHEEGIVFASKNCRKYLEE
jgi:hypothetical protein